MPSRELYEKYRQHPIRHLLQTAAAGGHVYDDQIDDLRLSPRLKGALREAINRVTPRPGVEVPKMGPNSPDQLALELVEALPAHHETRAQHEDRRAGEGDGEAAANRKAAGDALEELVDGIWNRRRGGL